MLFRLLVVLFSLFSQFTYAAEQTTSKIAIIIDDIGAKPTDAKAFSLNKNITFSILPHTEYSTDFSTWAAQQNREVMLHMPMESLHNASLGIGAIMSDMYPQQVKTALLNALTTVPHAVGVNNHMGSKLTQMTLQMNSVMEVLEQSNLFFVDSRTTRFSKAYVIANRKGIKSAQRQIFIDHYKDENFLKAQARKLVARARKEGKAIGIGHPYPITIRFLKQFVASLPDDIELITVSEYLQEENKFRINPLLAQQQITASSQSKRNVKQPSELLSPK